MGGTFINVYRCKTTAQRTYNLEIFENLMKVMTNKLISMPQIYIKRWNFRSKMPQMLLSKHTPSTAFFYFFLTKMIINSYLMYCGITCIRLLSDHTPTLSFPGVFFYVFFCCCLSYFFTKLIINSHLLQCGITSIKLLSDLPPPPPPSFPCFFVLLFIFS